MGLDINVRDDEGWRIIEVQGEVDLNSSPELRAAIMKEVEANRKVGVDLSGARYMDSSGVATLVEGFKTAAKNGFALIRPSNAVMRVLQLSRLDTLFDIRDNPSGG